MRASDACRCLLAAVIVRVGASDGPPRPHQAQAAAVVDREIGQVQVFLGRDVDNSFEVLAQEGRRPMGIEMLPQRPIPASADPRVVRRPGPPPPPLILGPGSFNSALRLLLDRQPDYESWIADGILNVAPKAQAHKSGHVLDTPIDRFEVNDVEIRQAVRVLRHVINPAFSDAPVTGTGGSIGGSSIEDIQRREAAAQALFTRHVTLAIDRPTPRQVLNRLVAQHGGLFWTATYRGRSFGDTVEAVETECTIGLHTFADIGITQQYGPARPPLPADQIAALRARVSSLPPSGRGGLLVRLPTDAISLPGAVRQWARGTQAMVGVETVVAGRTGGPAPGAAANTNLYNFSGLSPDAALDKLVGAIPDYIWRKDGDIYHVQPRDATDTSRALNRRVDRFEHDLASPFEALIEVHALMGARVNLPPDRLVQPPTFAPFTVKPISLALRDVTVREVLDAIVRAGHGSLMWVAEYHVYAAGTPQGLTLALDNLVGLGGVQVARTP